MNSPTYRRFLSIALLVFLLPATLVTICSERANGWQVHPANHADTDNADAVSDYCATFLASRLGVVFGELHSQIRYGRRADDAVANKPALACKGGSSLAIRIEWIVGESTVWSIEL